eukprot:Pgem_evm2s1850
MFIDPRYVDIMPLRTTQLYHQVFSAERQKLRKFTFCSIPINFEEKCNEIDFYEKFLLEQMGMKTCERNSKADHFYLPITKRICNRVRIPYKYWNDLDY